MRHPGSIPPRLRVGGAILAVLILGSLVGSPLSGDPTRIVDPAETALLPPGSSRTVITRPDGSTVAGRDARLTPAGWLVERREGDLTVPLAQVGSVRRLTFWLGTDTVGRDVLSRLLHGGIVSLLVGSTALVLAIVLGIGIGLAAGWWGGVLDAVLMRLVDALLAVPLLFLLLLLAVVFRPSLGLLIVLLGLSSWMGVARLVRGQVLSLKERDFVAALRGLGASPTRIAFLHLLPNAGGPLAQDAALRLGDLILVEASLSFLGLGVQPPVPSWGNMVAEGGALLGSAWWLIFPAGGAVALTVVGAALLADGLGELLR